MNEQNSIHNFFFEGQTFIDPADLSLFPNLYLYNLHAPVEGLRGGCLLKEKAELLPYSPLTPVFEQASKTALEFQIWGKSNIVRQPQLKQNH